jgi:hypothetical protein
MATSHATGRNIASSSKQLLVIKISKYQQSVWQTFYVDNDTGVEVNVEQKLSKSSKRQ